MRLRLFGAVEIQPLTREQIVAYLERAGEPLAGLRVTLDDDEVLGELLESPLFLSLAALTFREDAAMPVWSAGTLARRREILLRSYTERMLQSRSNYQSPQAIRWLAWLAAAMRKRNQSHVYLRWMQPDWLPSRTQCRAVTIGAAVSAALLGALLSALFGTPLALMPDGVPNDLPRAVLFPLLGRVS